VRRPSCRMIASTSAPIKWTPLILTLQPASIRLLPSTLPVATPRFFATASPSSGTAGRRARVEGVQQAVQSKRSFLTMLNQEGDKKAKRPPGPIRPSSR
jgi:hypothetical protein